MMNTFKVINQRKAQFNIDGNFYSKSVITKVLYWLASDYSISTTMTDFTVFIEIETISNKTIDWDVEKNKISSMLIDFQMREIIETETRDIRNILYIKAFANLDQFEEYVDE